MRSANGAALWNAVGLLRLEVESASCSVVDEGGSGPRFRFRSSCAGVEGGRCLEASLLRIGVESVDEWTTVEVGLRAEDGWKKLIAAPFF